MQSRKEVSDISAGLTTNFPKGAIPITVSAQFRSVKCRADEKLVTTVQGRADEWAVIESVFSQRVSQLVRQ
jgi:hypothetical protein